MLQTKNAISQSHKLALASLVIAGLLSAGSTFGFCANKSETIDASTVTA